MDKFIRPQFTRTVKYEALLSRTEVEQYAKQNGISLSDAIEVLGREYLAKHANYCIVGGESLHMVALDRE